MVDNAVMHTTFGLTLLIPPLIGPSLVLALPLLSSTGLIIVALIVESPVLRREPATPRRRAAASVLAVVSLIVATPLAVMSWSLGVFGLLLLGGLAIPAVLTLVRLRLPPRTETTH